MRLCTFSIGGEHRLGAGTDESRIVDVATAAKELDHEVPAEDLRSLIEAGPEAIAAVGELLGAVGDRADANWIHGVDQVTLHNPYRPLKNITKAHGNSKLACGKPREGAPIVLPPGRWLGGFPIRYHTKAPTAILDPGAPIVWPSELTSQVYAEPQLAIVIGEKIHYAEPEEVAGKIAGYAVATDVSSEDLKTKHGQWPKAVSLDSFFPWGPFVVTADEIDDADALDVSLELNGSTAISANTSETLIPIAEMLAELSLGISLDPGDVLMLGVPECLAFGEEPPRWLRAGDTLTSRIEGVGTLSNPVAPY
jgi:2-keto-4-pentenoate hydratase/2-oxohepta-3-ene-1,7-dioic acid hydratase in catechol pathway